MRCSALLWRIKTYDLLKSPSWDIQSKAILQHLAKDSIPFKKYCPLLQKYLLFTLSIKSFPKIQKEFISTGLTLSRRVWPKRCSYKTIFFDILMVEIPKIKHLIKKLLDKFEIKLFSILAHLLNLINRNSIWLVGEREDTAQENGLYFYKYLNRNKKNELAYYIINKKCDQYKSVKNVGKIVQFNSFKHKLLFCASTYYATSHNHYCIPKTKFRNTRYSLHKGLKNIFLDHGITYADVSEFYGKQNSGIDLFICGAKPEEDYVLDKFGYKLNEVAYTGFARFDGLHNFKTKKQILVMPTWRRDIYNLKNHFENEKELFFKNSLYYKVFQSLFTNVNLLELLEEYSYQLVFYPHYEIQDYLKHFTTTHDSIKIASKDDYIVQDLLKSASLLITDTSSVHFDFAYMYKPVIYYKFDKDTFTNTHLPEGYFKHEKMGFGEVIVEEERLINLIKKHLQNDCKMDEQYRNRVKDFYPLYDANNCERIYNSIVDNYE